jgi:phospholipid/cholesterol/gamma-HCH transport system permease protein
MTTIPLLFKDLASGLLKSVIFAVIISIVSCFEGFRTEGGAEGVGRATTTAVVTSFMLIIAADCICTALFYFVWR